MKAEEAIWPESRPHPEELFGQLRNHIVSIHRRQLLVGSQIIVRFKNGYGANILHDRLRAGLSEIAVLRFFGSGINDYDCIFNEEGPVPDFAWCFHHGEIFGLCEIISQLGEN